MGYTYTEAAGDVGSVSQKYIENLITSGRWTRSMEEFVTGGGGGILEQPKLRPWSAPVGGNLKVTRPNGVEVVLKPGDAFNTKASYKYTWTGTELVERYWPVPTYFHKQDKETEQMESKCKYGETKDVRIVYLFGVVEVETGATTLQTVTSEEGEDTAALIAAEQAGLTLAQYRDSYEVVLLSFAVCNRKPKAKADAGS